MVEQKFKNYLEVYPRITISEITYFEILSGLTFKKAIKQMDEFETFVSTCDLLKLSTASIRISAGIYSELRGKGITIGTADLLIAGIAVSNEMILVTNNQKHYQLIERLSTTNWTI